MPPKQKEIERKKNRIEYAFVVGIDLFSRYGFVKWFRICKEGDTCGKDALPESQMIEITEEPDEEVDAEGYRADIEDDGKATGLGAKQIIEGLEEWFKKIEDMGYELPTFFISDEGKEYKNKTLEKYLEEKEVNQGFTVPNDKIKNPIAERFIGTIKRLVGQYMTIKGSSNITPREVQDLVDFYNRRIHSSTGYSPDEILKGNENQDSTLFNYYRVLKSDMYLSQKEEIKPNTVVRIYNKWKTADKNIGDKKSNIPNWSATLYKVIGLNKSNNFYKLERMGEKDPRDRKFLDPPKQGLRRNFLQQVDYEALKKYSL
jgi:hypothetical protein